MNADATNDPAAFDAVFSNAEVGQRMEEVAPAFHAAAAAFWRAPLSGRHLSPRMKELVLFAMHVSASSLNAAIVRRQVGRVLAAGGTHAEIADAVTTIASVANHSVYASVPILEEEWRAAGNAPEPDAPLTAEMEEVKRRFIAVRGFWNAERDPLLRLMPDYLAALTGIATVTWAQGPLSRKDRELVCIAIDCTITHSYPPGLRMHIRNAIAEGATRGEIAEIFQLAALFGVEGYLIAAEAMFAES